MKYPIAALIALTLTWGSAAQAQNAQVASVNKSNFKVASSAYQIGYYGVAMRRWMNMANANDGAAQYNVGLMHFYGQGVRKYRVEAYKWFSIAASKRRREGSDRASARRQADEPPADHPGREAGPRVEAENATLTRPR